MERARIKDSYTISEISRLFGIGIDSLRYYERLGIIAPTRAANGYRIYGLNDLYRLAAIKELRSLGLGMEAIKRYLEHQDIAGTKALLADEERLIEEQIVALELRQEAIERRRDRIAAAEGGSFGSVEVLSFPIRRCVRISGHVERDEEMDLLISRLHRRYENQLPLLGSLTVGAFFDCEALAQGRANVFESVFFIVEDESVPSDFELPAGDYLTVRYRGPYAQDARFLAELARARNQRGMCEDAAPFEIYEIDNRDTACEEEFITRVEIYLQAEPAALG